MKNAGAENFGQSLGNKVILRISEDKLTKVGKKEDLIKFLGSEFWNYVYGKQLPKYSN